MTTVTVAETRERLPELLRRAAAGEQIVITEDGKWLAALTPPPAPPPTAEEIAAQHARAEAQVRKFLDLQPENPALDRDTVQRWFDEQRR
ncbi:MAG: type II toxin-antitoxin system prevent-host-death family antitoxin [Planctomycetes bacterium]|nr:type II toxin-antitoxin system prevent-host-death family antitoxin [Planctomycetota bacterium]